MTDRGTENLGTLQVENQRLRRAVEELSILNDLARAISASLDPGEIMGTVVRRSLRAVQAEQGVITLVEQKGECPAKTLIRERVSSSDHQKFHLHQALLGWMQLNKKPLMMNSPRVDERFRGVSWDETVRSLLCVPMMVKSELRGVLTVYNKKGDQTFSDDDLRLLSIISTHSAQILENARLNESQKQFLKMQQEVQLAARIQRDLLPHALPPIPGYEISGSNIPAEVVGGDHFDVLPAGGGLWAICLGDVSGKGLPASLLMANLQATLRSQVLTGLSPASCVENVNKLLYLSTSEEKFATLFYSLLDVEHHRLAFCNAGQNFPLLCAADGEVRTLETGGPAVAMLEGFPFEEETVPINPGDLLVICSDGIPEAMDPGGRQFGNDRLLETIRGSRGASASAVLDAVVEQTKVFVGTQPQSDDMTIIVLKRL